MKFKRYISEDETDMSQTLNYALYANNANKWKTLKSATIPSAYRKKNKNASEATC